MTQPIPNLFRHGEARDAHTTYELFLARLAILGRHHRIVEVCGRIRRFVAASGNKKAGIFTYFAELQALNSLQDWEARWRVLRRREVAIHGRRFDLKKRDWHGKSSEILFGYGPLLYFRGEYDLGCQLWEDALREAAGNWKNGSFDCLWHVYKADSPPTSIYQVTLWHFYQALGRDFKSWALWNKFVDWI